MEKFSYEYLSLKNWLKSRHLWPKVRGCLAVLWLLITVKEAATMVDYFWCVWAKLHFSFNVHMKDINYWFKSNLDQSNQLGMLADGTTKPILSPIGTQFQLNYHAVTLFTSHLFLSIILFLLFKSPPTRTPYKTHKTSIRSPCSCKYWIKCVHIWLRRSMSQIWFNCIKVTY